MKTAILGLAIASALGCAAVNDGRLETAVDNAEPITLVRGERHDAVIGTIETPEGICNGKAEVVLIPETYIISCGDYHFFHQEREQGISGHPIGSGRFSYWWQQNDYRGEGNTQWSWDATCKNRLAYRTPLQNVNEGELVEHSFYDNCEEALRTFESHLLVPYEDKPGRYYIDGHSPLTFRRTWEITEDSWLRNQVLWTQEQYQQDLNEYDALKEQMNVPEADKLWREWRHTALGYAE